MSELPREGSKKDKDKYNDLVVVITLGFAVSVGETVSLVFSGNFLLAIRGALVN